MPLVKANVSVYESEPEDVAGTVLHPLVVFGMFLAFTIFITARDLKRHKPSKWFDAIVFGVVGLVGLLLLLLWTSTDHHAAAKNMNLLWAMPLHLLFIPPYLMSKKIATTYFKGIAILIGLVLLGWTWLPQHLNGFLIPVVLALGIRAWFIGFKFTT
jgi:hypothetical protein